MAVTQHEDNLRVNPTYYYRGSLDYAGQDYVQCRELDADATRMARVVGIAGTIGGLGLIGASFDYETDSYVEGPNLPFLVSGIVTTAMSALGVIVPSAMLRNNKGRTCKQLQGQRYTLSDLRNFSPREQPWTLQVLAPTGEVLFEDEFEEMDLQTIPIAELDACALPNHILMTHPKSTLMNVEVVATVQRDGKTIQERVLHPLPFIERAALQDSLREQYLADLRRSAAASFLQLTQGASTPGLSVTIDEAPSLETLMQAAALEAPSVDRCGTPLEIDGPAALNIVWVDHMDEVIACLRSSCVTRGGEISIPVPSTFIVRTDTAPIWSWHVTVSDDGSLTSTPLGLTQVSTGGLVSIGPHHVEVQTPKINVPTLPKRHSDYRLDSWPAYSSDNTRWATSDSSFYVPESCELTHPICGQQLAGTYGFCREMICADIQPDVDKDSGFSAWAGEIRHIGGDLAVTPDDGLLRTGRLTYARLEIVEGTLHSPFLLASTDHRAPRFSFPVLHYAGSLNFSPDNTIGVDSSKRTTIFFPRLREVSSLTLSGIRAGNLLRVEAPALRRIQQNLYINETLLTSEGLRRLTPALTEVAGDVVLHVVLGLDSLRGLENLRVIHGDLILTAIPNLTSLDGLRSLECVKGSIVINGNESLRSLRGLRNLRSVGSPSCGEEPDNTMEVAVQIINNANLLSLDGLESIHTISGVVEVTGNPQLADIEALGRVNARGFVLRWGTGITRFTRAFEAVEANERVCWVDAKTEEKIGEAPCFLLK